MLVIGIALLGLALGLPAQNLVVVSPNGGETLTLGQTVQLTWTANNVNQKVKLQLIRGGGALVGLIAGNLNATPSSFTWTVGQYEGGTAAADTNYKIRIHTADSALEDASNGTFAIIGGATPPPASLRLTNPNASKEMQLGATCHITWEGKGLDGSNRLELWKGTAKVGDIAQGQPANQGDFTWKIGDILPGKASAGSGYKVKVVNSAGLADESDQSFTLNPGMESALAGPETPVQRSQLNFQQQTPMVNAQIVPYAVITSFTVDGHPASGVYHKCFRAQGVLCQANAFSQTRPILYRYALHLIGLENGSYAHVVHQTPWIEQNSYTFTISQAAAMNAVYGDGNYSMVPISLFGRVYVEVKNATQSESPQMTAIGIQLYL